MSPSYPNTEVFNQPSPFCDINLFTCDVPLVEAVAANGARDHAEELSLFGRLWGMN